MRCKFVVSLVQHNYNVGRNIRYEPIQYGSVEHRAGRIIRIGEKNQTCVFVDRAQDRVGIETVIPHRSFDQVRARRLHGEPVDDK